MINYKFKIYRMILLLCIIIPIIILLFEIIYKNNYKSISYCLIPIITGITGLISSYSLLRNKEK